jgi:hypothetical protein
MSQYGFTLFPSEEFHSFDQQLDGWDFVDGAQWGQWKEDPSIKGGFIVGCYDYEFAFGQSGQTRVSYWLAKNTPGRGIILNVGYNFDPEDREVPMRDLVFHPWGGKAT